MSALRWAVTGFLAVKSAVLISNARSFPVLSTGRPNMQHSQRVSLLIPVRNEVERLELTMPGLLAQDADEILFLDDCSSDGTADLAARLIEDAGVGDRARVIDGRPMPEGWVGKTWACHQLSELATGDLLVFCDADIVLAPGALNAMVQQQSACDAELFSVFPRQLTHSFAEHLTIPAVDDAILGMLPIQLLDLEIPAAAAANGSVMIFTADSYAAIGGFAAVRGHIVEDLALARLTREQGRRLRLALGGNLVGTRMYASYRDILDGLAKGLPALTGGSRAALVAAWSASVVTYALPPVLSMRERRWLPAVAMALGQRVLVEHKTGRRQYWQAVLVPVSPLAMGPIVAKSLRAQQSWRGRVYR